MSSNPNKSIGPAKLEKSTFCGPFNFNFPTGEDTVSELPGPDRMFWVSMLEVNCIPPVSDSERLKLYDSLVNFLKTVIFENTISYTESQNFKFSWNLYVPSGKKFKVRFELFLRILAYKSEKNHGKILFIWFI